MSKFAFTRCVQVAYVAHAVFRQKELASKRGKWSEPEVDRFLKRFLKVGEPLCAGGQALDWSPLAEGGSDALCVKTVEAMHLFYRSVWLWAGGVYPAAKPLADEVCSLPYLNPDGGLHAVRCPSQFILCPVIACTGVPVIVNFSDPTVAAAVDAGVATLRAPDLKKLKLGM